MLYFNILKHSTVLLFYDLLVLLGVMAHQLASLDFLDLKQYKLIE